MRLTSATMYVAFFSIALHAQPQEPPGTAAPSAPSAASPWSRYGTDFSIWLDGYADANFNHPDSSRNELRNFDYRADTAHLSLAKISIDHAPAPFGFHADVGFGQSLYGMHALDPGPDAMKYVEQAFVSFRPKAWKGLEIDYGKFATSAGAEVIEAYSNWNYSRSLLFAWAIPYYHVGVRATFPVGQHFTGGAQLVNGWNNDADNNSGKTIGLTGNYTWKRVTWSNTYYGGPEKTNTNKGVRQLYDTVVQVNQNDNNSYYLNFDAGRDKNLGPGARTWVGVAVAARHAFGPRFAIAPRIEFLDDRGGLTTGVVQNVKEVTLTGEYKVNQWLVARLEIRNDWSDHPSFQQSSGQGAKSQATVLLGMLAYFGPKK